MKLELVDGKLVQVREVASLDEQRMASFGRRMVKNHGGHIEPGENYGKRNLVHCDSEGFRSVLTAPRRIQQLTVLQ